MKLATACLAPSVCCCVLQSSKLTEGAPRADHTHLLYGDLQADTNQVLREVCESTHRDTDICIVDVAGDLHLIYTRLVTRRQGFEFSSHCERATHLALPMCGFERVAALILEPVSKGACVSCTSRL